MFRVFGRYVSAGTSLLVIAEAVVVCAIIYAGAAIFSGNIPPSDLVVRVAFVAIAVVLVMHSTGLYDETSLIDLRQSWIKLAFVITPIFMLAVITTGILARNDVVPIYPYRWQWTLGLTTLWFASALGGRLFFSHLHDQGRFTRLIALVGDSQLASRVRDLANSRPYSIRIVAQLEPSDSTSAKDQPSAYSAFVRATKGQKVHEIVIDPGALSQESVADLIRLKVEGYPVVKFTHLFEREAGCVELDSVKPQALLFSKGLKKGPVFSFVKRGMDIALALVGLILFLPVMLMAAIALRLERSGPIFYRQERIGQYGKPFMILKFRSMRVDAEQNGKPCWASEYDPRITPVGRVIRKVRIDELPQFLNVLRGEMSIVGPRPERPYFVSELGARLPFYNERHLVRPGITGWAQVSFHYGASFEDAMRKHSYDLYYLKHRSLWLDFLILLKTVRIVLFAEGAR